MDLRTVSSNLPEKMLIASVSGEVISNCVEEDSESELDSEDEDEAEAGVGSSDSDSSTGNSVNCPICLLKFKGQAIGFPEVCGHPFCLDCILEWSKNVQTCPNDRQKFGHILVRLDLDGEVVKKIPVCSPNKEEEDDGSLDITECQVCQHGDREDMLLLCDRCDQGYHMDCLDPPLEEVPIEDWFCPQCLGVQPSAAISRRRAPLALRVRRTIQRSRQRILRDSSVTKTRTTKTKRKTNRTMKSKSSKRKSYKRSTTTRRRKLKSKGKSRKGRNSKKILIPSPRKRLADALGINDKPSNTEPGSHFSLFGDPNALDTVIDEIVEPFSTVPVSRNEPKSLIAKLAEKHKSSKSVFSYGPVAVVTQPTKPLKPAALGSSTSNPDLLGSILASQSQLSSFGKAPEVMNKPKPKRNNSSRVLGAILASQATLNILDGTSKAVAKESSLKAKSQLSSLSKTVDIMRMRCCDDQPKDAAEQTNSSSQDKKVTEGSTDSKQNASQSQMNGHSSGEPVRSGTKGGCGGGGDGEDPNKNQKRKSEPRDKSDNPEEDPDIFSDIESMDENTEQRLPSVDQTDTILLPLDDKNSEEEDEKGLVIDDSTTEDPTAQISDFHDVEDKVEKQQNEKGGNSSKEMSVGVRSAASSSSATSTICNFQHGGLPAAAAALSLGPKGLTFARPEARLRSSSTTGPVIDEAVKASLVSTIASALKESLTSALLAQSQTEALVDQEEEIPLPRPTYSEPKPISESPEPTIPKEVITALSKETSEVVSSVNHDVEIKTELTNSVVKDKSDVKCSRKRRMEEIFGSDDETKNQADQLEQISDCEEGELDESEAEGMSDVLPSGNRIVRMLTPPPPSDVEKTRSTKNGDHEEGEIIDKRQINHKNAKKRKGTEDLVLNVDDEILREAGIGGERRVEVCIENEDIPSTFKKLDSGKTRHYRHQGEIKVIEGRSDVKVKKEQSDEKMRSKRQDIKRYDVRRVVEQKSSHRSSSKGDVSQRSRSASKSRSKSHSSKKSKSHRKRSSSSSSISSSSSDSSMSSLSPERSRKDKDKHRHHKRSCSTSSEEEGKRAKRKTKRKSRDRSEDKSSLKEKKKKAKKKKKMKEKHKEKKMVVDVKDRIEQTEVDPNGDDIEIPSKAVFASGDKIVVSLHFGSSGTSKQVPKKKKRKSESRERSSKKIKEDDHTYKKSRPLPSKLETSDSKDLFQSESTKASSKLENSSTPPGLKSKSNENKSSLESKLSSKTNDQRRNGDSTKPNIPLPGKRTEPTSFRGAAIRPRPRPLHRQRGKPVLIDIETSREIPLEESRPSDVIVLSDSDSETPTPIIDSASIPLPPTPPPPLPSDIPPEPPKQPSPKQEQPKLVEPKVSFESSKLQNFPSKQQLAPPLMSKSSVPPTIRNRGGRSGLLLKQGAGVKFSFSSKINSLKRLNPVFQTADEDEEEESQTSGQPAEKSDEQVQANATEDTSHSKSSKHEEPSALVFSSSSKADDEESLACESQHNASDSSKTLPDVITPKRASASPIFHPSTPPDRPPSANASYDPSHPTRTPSSGTSTPSLPDSPAPLTKMRPVLPPLPPLPAPSVLNSFPLPHPAAVLIPPMTSLPPPPLPPPPLLGNATHYAVHPPGKLLPGVAGMYNTSIPPPVLLPIPQTVTSLPNLSVKPPVPSSTQLSATVSTKTPGRPMTPPSPTPSEGSDIFGPPSPVSSDSPSSDRDERHVSSSHKHRPQASHGAATNSSGFDLLFQIPTQQKVNFSQRPTTSSSKSTRHHVSSSTSSRTAVTKDKSSAPNVQSGNATSLATSLAQDSEELPSSAVELQVKEKFLKKLNRQERVVEEVRLALKPYYTTKKISKGDYKEILRKCVPKICHTKSGEINPIKIKEMVKGYVKKFRYHHKKEVVAQ